MTINKIINIKRNWVFVTSFSFVFILVIWTFGIVEMSKLGFIGLVLLMIFSVILKSNTIALGLIFTTAFTEVIFHFVGITRMVPILFTELCILILFAKAFYIKIFIHRKPLRAVGFYPMLGVLLVTFVSSIFNQSELLPAIFFIRQTFIYYLFFIALQNLSLSGKSILQINKYIVFLFLIQLPTSLLKVVTLGPDEKWIGTVSWQAGQLSTTLPLFAIAFLASFYLFKKEKKYFLLIVGFILFAIIGQKRAFIFFLPLILLAVLYFYRKLDASNVFFSIKQIKNIIYFFIFACFTFYIGVITLPDLSQGGRYNEGSVGGSFDPKHIINYFVWYNNRDTISHDNVYNSQDTQGRWAITKSSFKQLQEKGLIYQLIGFGPGAMIQSPHLGRKEVIFEQFSIRGATPGAIKFTLQLGFLGDLFLTYFFLVLFRKTYLISKKSSNTNFKLVALGFLGATLMFLMDFFIYGSSLFLGVLTPVYFYVASILLMKDHQNFQLL